MYGNVTNADIDILNEITEATVFKVIVLHDHNVKRPRGDKFPIISVNTKKKNVRKLLYSTIKILSYS